MEPAMHMGLLHVHICSSLGPVRDQRPGGQAARVDFGCCLHYLLAVDSVDSADSGRHACVSLYEVAHRCEDSLWA
jgi:hypothetical protein